MAFVGVATVVIVTPGQDTALTIRNSLLGGRRGGIFTALGVAAGQCVWAIAASAGVVALIVASEPAFLALRLVGAAYLIYLGLQALYAAVRRGEPSNNVLPARPRPVRQGLISNLSNPKMAVFFPSLLPQFADSFVPLLGLGLLFAAMTFAWLSTYAVVVARTGDVLRRPGIRRVIDAFVGATLTAFGLRLAADRG